MTLRKVFASLFKSIQLGRKVSECYAEVYEALKAEKDEAWLNKHLGSNFGYGIGFKQQENSLEIVPTNHTVLEENTVIFLRLYFKDLEYRGKTGYGISIGDTVVLSKNGCKNLTKGIRKNYEDISYVIDDDDEGSEEEKEDVLEANGIEANNITATRFRAGAQIEKRNEIKRKEHQDELLNIKLAELNERIANKEIVISSSKQKAKNMSEVRSYRNPKELPQNMAPRRIFIDDKRDTILFPVGKKNFMVIHMLFVKSLSLTGADGGSSFLRINLHTPGAMNINQNMIFPSLPSQNGMFLKELTFRSNDAKSLNSTCKSIREHLKKMKQLEKEREQNITLAKAEQLSQNKGKKIIMDYLVIRPNITARKTVGTLEAHTNGLRYTSNQNPKIDINYNNIKH